jgi:hypothetical protein
MFQPLGIVMIIACEIGTETPQVGLIIFIVFPDLVLWLPNLLNYIEVLYLLRQPRINMGQYHDMCYPCSSAA